MELSYLKKHTRSHKYLALLKQSEINAILNRYVPRLRSIQILNVKKYAEVQDEYHELTDHIVEEARVSLNFELRTKIEKKYVDRVIVQSILYAISST